MDSSSSITKICGFMVMSASSLVDFSRGAWRYGLLSSGSNATERFRVCQDDGVLEGVGDAQHEALGRGARGNQKGLLVRRNSRVHRSRLGCYQPERKHHHIRLLLPHRPEGELGFCVGDEPETAA